MTEWSCSFGANRDEAIVAYLYDDPAAASVSDRGRFETHLQTCARCRGEVAALRGVRAQLARWSPPEPITRQSNQPSPFRHEPSWRSIPAWAQVAAALLFLGVSAGIANLDVRYDQSGLTVRTGWSARPDASGRVARSGGSDVALVSPVKAAGRANDAPWKADLAALASELKNEMRTSPASAATVRTVSASASDAEITRRVRALVEESEKRQQRELALRIAEMLRDINAQRQADLVKIDRTLGAVQNNVGIEVMKTRQQINQMDLIYRASQRQ
ncbi:MAG: hypothetical protein JWL71_1373 [Acidobacteria bacterium]|nr:hypothetical protein [Acidobacteriota bacterium]